MRLIIVAPPLFENRIDMHTLKHITNFCITHNIPFKLIKGKIHPNVNNYNDLLMGVEYTKSVFKVLKILKNNDIIFWGDVWNPNIHSIFHFSESSKINIKNYGVLKSNPLIKGEYIENSSWGKTFLESLLKNINCIFTATKYLKNTLPNTKNVKVTGYFLPAVIKTDIKEYSIIYPHRWDLQRNPLKFVELAKWWKINVDDNLQFKVITPCKQIYDLIKQKYPILIPVYNPKKSEYYNNISKAKYIWSNSLSETFGYAVAEAYLSGAIPILNDIPCYRELYPNSIYTSFNEMVNMIKTAKYEDVIFNYQDNAIENMFNIINQDTGLLEDK
jgi:hypothetical protein